MKLISGFNRRSPVFETKREPHKTVVLDYLSGFEPRWRSAAPFIDPVSRENTGIQLDAFTDDEWGWDSGEVFMFKKYDLALDPEFVSKVMESAS